MQFYNLSAGSEIDKCDTTEILAVFKPVGKRATRCMLIIASGLVFNSLGAMALEAAPGQVKDVAKAAKSTKAMGKTTKKCIQRGAAIIACANAGAGAEEVYKEVVPKPYLVMTMTLILLCGFLLGKNMCEE